MHLYYSQVNFPDHPKLFGKEPPTIIQELVRQAKSMESLRRYISSAYPEDEQPKA